MCSILYTRRFKESREWLSPLIKKQLPRWEESLWIISHHRRALWETTDSIKKAAYDNWLKIANGYIDEFFEWDDEANGAIMHMRKASIWSWGIDNVHPLELSDRYLIVQNWTFKPIIDWASIQFRDFDKDKTDTYYLWKFLVASMTKDNMLQALATLKRLSTVGPVGIIFLIDRVKGRALFYSDGNRECYIESTETNVSHISNYHPTEEDWKYKTEGHILFNIKDGSIINKNITESKTKKWSSYKPSTTPTAKSTPVNRAWSWNSSTSWHEPYEDRQYGSEPDNYEDPDTPPTNREIFDEINYTPSQSKKKKLSKLIPITRWTSDFLVEMDWFSETRLVFQRMKKFLRRYPVYSKALHLAMLNLQNNNVTYVTYELMWFFREALTVWIATNVMQWFDASWLPLQKPLPLNRVKWK